MSLLPKLIYLSGIVFLLLFMVALPASAAEFGSCYGVLRKPLSQGGFSGEPDCNKISLRVDKLGKVTRTRDSLDVYLIVYRSIPEPGMVSHGGEKIIILKDDKLYLGQYSITPNPLKKIRIEGGELIFQFPKDTVNRVKINAEELPEEIYVGGESVTLYK
jgi:hypothetical protein